MFGSERSPGEELLSAHGVRLVREVARALLEDDEVEGEAVFQSPHHGKLVQQAVSGEEVLVVLARQVGPLVDLAAKRFVFKYS